MNETSHGSPEKLRETISGWLWFAIRNAENAITSAEIGDDQGLAYSIRRLTSYVEAIIPTLGDLLEQHPQAPGRAKVWTTTEEGS